MDRARLLILEAAEQGRSIASGTVILADTMTHSKGRFTRSWHAPSGGIWGCMIHANTLLPSARRFIPLAVGVACCQTIHDLGGDAARLRWVNDILIQGCKVAGFLVESYVEPLYHEEFTIVGFGINCNNTSFPNELEGTAASLSQMLGQEIDLVHFVERFLARLGCCIGLLCYEEVRELRGDGFSGKDNGHLLLQWWRELSDTAGQKVVYGFDVMTAPQYEAQAVAMDADGGLILQLPDGTRTIEYSGEVRYLK